MKPYGRTPKETKNNIIKECLRRYNKYGKKGVIRYLSSPLGLRYTTRGALNYYDTYIKELIK